MVLLLQMLHYGVDLYVLTRPSIQLCVINVPFAPHQVRESKLLSILY